MLKMERFEKNDTMIRMADACTQCYGGEIRSWTVTVGLVSIRYVTGTRGTQGDVTSFKDTLFALLGGQTVDAQLCQADNTWGYPEYLLIGVQCGGTGCPRSLDR